MKLKLTVEELRNVLATYGKGVLSSGGHGPDEGLYCALECVSLARHNGRKNFTDSRELLGMPDIRPLNDAMWSSDQARTEALLPLIAALSDWSQWSTTRQHKWATIVAVETVRQIISRLTHLPDVVRKQCRQALDAGAAEAAMAAAAAAAARAAARAAEAAAGAAEAGDGPPKGMTESEKTFYANAMKKQLYKSWAEVKQEQQLVAARRAGKKVDWKTGKVGA